MSYKLKYRLDCEQGEFEQDEVIKEGKGACDALIVGSVLYPKEGGYSSYFFSYDGRNEAKPLSDEELWKAWAMLAAQLSQSDTLNKNKKEFCIKVFSSLSLVLRGLPN